MYLKMLCIVNYFIYFMEMKYEIFNIVILNY